MSTYTERTLDFGDTSCKIKWNNKYNIQQLVCLALNKHDQVRRIYYLQMDGIETDMDGIETDEDGIEAGEDGIETDEDGNERDVMIYGLDEENKVLIMGSGQPSNDIELTVYNPEYDMNLQLGQQKLMVKQNISKDAEGKLLGRLVFLFKESNQPADETNQSFCLQIIKLVNSQSMYMKLTQTTGNRIKSFKNIASRTELSVRIIKLQKLSDMVYQMKDTSEEINFITHNSRQDVEVLLQMANAYTVIRTDQQVNKWRMNRSVEVEYLFRCKPKLYMDAAFESGIMEKYKKDNNGDPVSSINNKIDGLFFTAMPELDGTLPVDSFFGDSRIKIKPQDFVNGLNLYFADFYCLYKETHYVTLVLTKPGSSEEKYCRNRLVKLDWKNNLFFAYDETDQKYSTSNAFYFNVEVFYTEDLNLQEIACIQEDVTPMGQGTSTPGGIPKNSKCNTCNLVFH